MDDGPNQLATRPPGWRLVRIGVALLAAATILICLDMLAYLKLWYEIVQAKGIPTPERVMSTMYAGLPPLVLCVLDGLCPRPASGLPLLPGVSRAGLCPHVLAVPAVTSK